MERVNLRGIKTRTHLIGAAFSLLLPGCAGTYSMVEFEVLEPAAVRFPEGISKVLFLNRAPLTLDAFSPEDRRGLERSHLIILDSAIIRSIQQGWLDVIRQSPMTEFHQPVFAEDRRSDTANLADRILTKREVAAYCAETGTDAIISLEYYSMDLDIHTELYEGPPLVPLTSYYELSDRLQWNIYLPYSPKPFHSYNLSDTLFYANVVDGQRTDIPPLIDMIRELFYEGGRKYGNYLVPSWTPAVRSLFRGGDELLREAGRHTDRGEWAEAYTIWRSLASGNDSTLAAKAFHNLAVYYELEDRLDSASRYVERAMELDTLSVIRSYAEELETRLQHRKRIIRQVY